MHSLLQASLAAVSSLSWRTVEERIGWPRGSSEMIPVPHNVVETIYLETCRPIGSATLFALNGKYNKGQFACFRLKYKDPRCAILNYFAGGRSIVVGAKTPNSAFFALHQLRRYLEHTPYAIRFTSLPQISNIVLATFFDYALNIAAMSTANASNTNYVPRDFSATCYRPFPQAKMKGCKVMLFDTGAATTLGITTMLLGIAIALMNISLVAPFRVSSYKRKNKADEREAEHLEEKRKYSALVAQREAKRKKLPSFIALTEHENELSEGEY